MRYLYLLSCFLFSHELMAHRRVGVSECELSLSLHYLIPRVWLCPCLKPQEVRHKHFIIFSLGLKGYQKTPKSSERRLSPVLFQASSVE